MKKIFLIVPSLLIGILIGSYLQYNYLINKKSEQSIINYPPTLVNNQRLIDSLFKTGDVSLYRALKIQYEPKPAIDFLGIAMIMANKYDYPEAYSDVFYSFHSIFMSDLSADTSFNYSNYDAKSKRIAEEYLNIAFKRHELNALEMKCKYDKNCNYRELLDSIYDSK